MLNVRLRCGCHYDTKCDGLRIIMLLLGSYYALGLWVVCTWSAQTLFVGLQKLDKGISECSPGMRATIKLWQLSIQWA